MEEFVAWIVVPMIAIMAYWGWLQVQDYIKATPLMSIVTGRDRTPAAP